MYLRINPEYRPFQQYALLFYEKPALYSTVGYSAPAFLTAFTAYIRRTLRVFRASRFERGTTMPCSH